MAEDGKNNGEFLDDRTVDISGYETPDSDSKTSALNERIAVLEQENRQFVHDKDVLEKKIADLKKSMDESSEEKEELKKEFEKSKSEVKTLESVAARAAELESEVSRLQHDLISTMSELEEANSELSKANVALDGVKKSETEQAAKLEAIVEERDLLMKKYSELEVTESKTREEINGKEKEMRGLKEKIEELKSTLAKVAKDKEGAEDVKDRLQKLVAELEQKVEGSRVKLEEQEEVISLFKQREKAASDGKVVMNGVGKGHGLSVGGKQVEWPIVVSSVVGAVGLVGAVYYLRYSKRA